MAAKHSAETVDSLLGESVDTTPSPLLKDDLHIEGTYVTLQEVKESDMPSLWKNLGLPTNEELFSYLPMSPPADPETLWSTLQDLRTKEYIIYAIKADPMVLSPSPSQPDLLPTQRSETLGLVAYLNIEPLHRAIEIGVVVYGPALQRTAAATEAQYLMLCHAFGASDTAMLPPYRRVVWKCNSLNKASRRAAERLGFVYEGRFRKHLLVKGRSRDSDWLSIVDDEWHVVRDGFEAWLCESNFDKDVEQIRTLVELRDAVREQSANQ